MPVTASVAESRSPDTVARTVARPLAAPTTTLAEAVSPDSVADIVTTPGGLADQCTAAQFVCAHGMAAPAESRNTLQTTRARPTCTVSAAGPTTIEAGTRPGAGPLP